MQGFGRIGRSMGKSTEGMGKGKQVMRIICGRIDGDYAVTRAISMAMKASARNLGWCSRAPTLKTHIKLLEPIKTY